MDVNIRIYSTHIKVFPYHLGDCIGIEKMLSKYDRVYYRYIPLAYYIRNDVLYLPKGISITTLQNMFQTQAVAVENYTPYDRIRSFKMLSEPRGQIQKDSIDFLTSQNEFKRGASRIQYGLNLDTGDGKTFCCISAIAFFKIKSIIITHKRRLKKQWIEEFYTKTNIRHDRVVNIEGKDMIEKIMKGKIKGDIYVVTHQTLQAYCRIGSDADMEPEYDWSRLSAFFEKIKVGIKIVDEAHKFFENSLKIDFFTDVYKSFYLTATFTRNEVKEKRIFKLAYQYMYRFGEETFNYIEKRKHIQLVNVLIRSNPVNVAKTSMRTMYGFSSYKYIEYELFKNPDETLMKAIIMLIDKVKHLEGKILINSPSIDSVEKIAAVVEERTNIPVGTVHSKNSKEKNAESYEKRIISSTVKSIGEGDNIKGLRVLINTEPIGSEGLADQLRGRLREYDKEKDTFLFYIVDTSVRKTYDYMMRMMPMMKRKCKQVNMMQLDI